MKTISSLTCLVLSLAISATLPAQFRGGQGDGHHESSASATAALPLTILSLEAHPSPEGQVEIIWVTEDESDTETMTIERSADGTAFNAIGNLPAAGDAPGQRLTYTFTDPVPLPGTSYYRLRVTDFDGSLTLSSVVSVTREGVSAPSFSLYPNPTGGIPPTLSILNSGAKDATRITAYDLRGRELFRFNLPGTGGSAPLPPLARGSYRIVAEIGELRLSRLLLVTD